MSHNFFGKTLVTPIECAMESPCIGVTSVFPKNLWHILSSLHLTQKLASVRKHGKISFDFEKSNPFSVDQISTTMISFMMVECAMEGPCIWLSIVHPTDVTSKLFDHRRLPAIGKFYATIGNQSHS